MAPTPSATPGVSTEGVVKALGAKHVEYTGDLAKVVHRYLLRSYPAADVAWVLDPAIKWTFEPDVPIDTINYARRPGGRNEEKVAAIAESVNSGASMDFVVLADFGEPKLRIADGFHRILGAEKAGKDAVPAMVASDVPEQYRETVMGPMQADSSSVEKTRVELRKWRQKAIAAVKRGESAAVPFRSDVIPAAHRDLIATALAKAGTVEDVWDLFGTPAPSIPPLGHRALAAAHAAQADQEQAATDQLAKIAADQADQHGREMGEVVAAVKAMADRPIVVNVPRQPAPIVNVPAPIVNVKAPAARPVTKTVRRDAAGRITEVIES